jgi:IS5 family transposase
MKPKTAPTEGRQGDLFRVELTSVIDMAHALVKLANTVDWDRFEQVFGETYCAEVVINRFVEIDPV